MPRPQSANEKQPLQLRRAGLGSRSRGASPTAAYLAAWLTELTPTRTILSIYSQHASLSMHHLQAAKVILVDCAAKGIVVFDTMSLRTVFPGESPSAFRRLVGALANAGVLVRVVKGVYLGATAKQTVGSRFGGKLIGAIRPGCMSYLSLEYALAEWGSMSQIPQRWTLMTTGRRGEFHTPVGTFEFTHTKREPAEILARTSIHPQLGARLAHPDLALEDLRRTRRNLHLVDVEDHAEIVAEFRAAQRGEAGGKPNHAEGGARAA